LSHEELSAERKKLAAANWNTVMSEIEANMDEQADLRVISSYDPPRIAEIGEVAQTLVPKIRAAMKIKGDGPLVKGKISVFVFERRYDFNEFGVMIDGREIMGSTYISSIAPDAPRWFSDGMGYWIATKAAPRAEGVSQWDEDGETFAKAMAKPDDFIRGQLPDDRAALVGFYFVSQLRGKNSGKFTRLLTMLEDNQPFEEAFRAVYGSTPNEYVGGSNKEPKRRRR